MKVILRWVSLIIVTIAVLSSATTVLGAGPEKWQSVKGTYVRENNSQYDSGLLRVMYLDNDCTLFEFKHLKGSENENSAFSFSFSGVMLSGSNGTAVYEAAVDNSNLRLKFDLKGDSIVVRQEGTQPINVSGIYTFQEQDIEVSDESAKEILEFISPAATSLNHNNGEYKLTYAEEMVGRWFYDVKANFSDTGALIADFWIARDMSSVYRVDTEKPILIYGSAQPLMDAEYMVGQSRDADQDVQLEDGTKSDNTADEPYSVSYVTAASEKAVADIGDTVKIIVSSPGNLPFTLEATSSDSTIASVNKDGVITAKSAGNTNITVKLDIDGAAKTFELPFGVIKPVAGSAHQGGVSNGDGIIVVMIIAILLTVGAVTGVIILIRHQAKKKVTRS